MRILPAVLAVILLSPRAAVATLPPTIPVTIVVPVVEGSKVVRQADATGAIYPVFRAALDDRLFQAIRRVLAGDPAQASLRLDRYARNARIAEENTAGRAPDVRLSMPMVLLVSEEEGGFARHGFWLERPDGQRILHLADYVDLVVRESDVEDGSFEEIFCHELAHLVLRVAFGPALEGTSPKMHQSMTVTDDATALDEGYAEHFQVLVRDGTANPHVRETRSGATTADLEDLWLSRADRALRTYGVKQNLFIYQKALMPSALEDDADRYRVFLDGETSSAFVSGDLKTGQQMLASEGVVATLFYRLVGSKRLRESYRGPAFYAPFLGGGPVPAEPAKAITPLDNVQMKLLAALRESGRERSKRPAMARVIASYARVFPDEAKSVYDVFLSTTRGVTVSQKLALLFREAATEGLRGNMGLFRVRSREAFALLEKTLEEVRAGTLAIDANVGPALWLRNEAFSIARTAWQEERTSPLVMNLNTATVPELMTVPGVSCAIAGRIVAARTKRGFFHSVDELAAVEGVPAPVARTFVEMPRVEAPGTGGAQGGEERAQATGEPFSLHRAGSGRCRAWPAATASSAAARRWAGAGDPRRRFEVRLTVWHCLLWRDRRRR